MVQLYVIATFSTYFMLRRRQRFPRLALVAVCLERCSCILQRTAFYTRGNCSRVCTVLVIFGYAYRLLSVAQ